MRAFTNAIQAELDRADAAVKAFDLPKAEGLTPEQMQQITREFNFSETAFVFPAESGHTRRVRIFTPASEIPFAADVPLVTGPIAEAWSSMGLEKPGAGGAPCSVTVAT